MSMWSEDELADLIPIIVEHNPQGMTQDDLERAVNWCSEARIAGEALAMVREGRLHLHVDGEQVQLCNQTHQAAR